MSRDISGKIDDIYYLSVSVGIKKNRYHLRKLAVLIYIVSEQTVVAIYVIRYIIEYLNSQ